jgi:hypothetical protein
MTQVGSIQVSLQTIALMIFIIGCPFGHLHLFLLDFNLGGFQFDILVWLPKILNVRGLADESAINMLPTNSAIFKRIIG